MAGTIDDERQLRSIPKIDDGFRAANSPAWPSRRDPKRLHRERFTLKRAGIADCSECPCRNGREDQISRQAFGGSGGTPHHAALLI